MMHTSIYAEFVHDGKVLTAADASTLIALVGRASLLKYSVSQSSHALQVHQSVRRGH